MEGDAALPAAWSTRAAALAVDVLPGLGVVATMALLALTAPTDGWLRWVFAGVGAAAMFAMALNRLVLPFATGWTLGRALFGIAVRRSPATARRVALPENTIRRLTAGALIASAVLCVGGVGLGYALAYRPERAVNQARAQIAEQGPRIVEQMLSYSAQNLPADFARAQALSTDGYRPQLIAQQQAVRKAGASTNEYWAVSGAVLPDPPVTAERASMLLAMQGRRGVNPEDLKFITATVRADFVKSADGQWRVANLTVLKKPRMNQAGP